VGPLQDAEMLRDRRPGHGEVPGEFANRLRTLQQPLEDGAPCRIAQRIELSGVLVSCH
jgi:hypothetical protein